MHCSGFKSAFGFQRTLIGEGAPQSVLKKRAASASAAFGVAYKIAVRMLARLNLEFRGLGLGLFWMHI